MYVSEPDVKHNLSLLEKVTPSCVLISVFFFFSNKGNIYLLFVFLKPQALQKYCDKEGPTILCYRIVNSGSQAPGYKQIPRGTC